MTTQGPPPTYGDDCAWPYDGEDGAPACQCDACRWVRAHPDAVEAAPEPVTWFGDAAALYDQCWWCDAFTDYHCTALLMVDAQPIIHAACVDEYLSTTDLPRLTPAERQALDAWCLLYDDGTLPIYTPETATIRRQLP